MDKAGARTSKLVIELMNLREELRLRAHLGGLEARALWRRIEPRLADFERELDRRGAQALDVAGVLALELARALMQHVPDSTLAETPVREVMQKDVATCSRDELLLTAAERLYEEHCGALVVTAFRHGPIAMLTDRDLALAARSRDVPFAELRVRDAMSREMHCCTPECSVSDAISVMRTVRVRRLPVIDGERRLIGIVGLEDVACYVQARVPAGIPTALQAEIAGALAAVATPGVVHRRMASTRAPEAT